MTRIDVERRPRSAAPWWTWVVLLVIIILLALAAWYFLSGYQRTSSGPGGPRTGEMSVTLESAPAGGVMGPAQEHVVWLS